MQQEINIHLLALTLTSLCDFHFQLSACCHPSLKFSPTPSSSAERDSIHRLTVAMPRSKPHPSRLCFLWERDVPCSGPCQGSHSHCLPVGLLREGFNQKLKSGRKASLPGVFTLVMGAFFKGLVPTGSALEFPSIRCFLSLGSQNPYLFFASLASGCPDFQVSGFCHLSALCLLTDSNI